MNYLNLSSDFLKDVEQYCAYDESIPFHYRVIAKLLSENNYDIAKQIIEANLNEFTDNYSYLILDFAIEMCLNIVTDENGIIYANEYSMTKEHIYKPTTETIAFIEFLLKNDFDPHLPMHFNQMEHIQEIEEDCMSQTDFRFDCSKIKQLISNFF